MKALWLISTAKNALVVLASSFLAFVLYSPDKEPAFLITGKYKVKRFSKARPLEATSITINASVSLEQYFPCTISPKSIVQFRSSNKAVANVFPH